MIASTLVIFSNSLAWPTSVQSALRFTFPGTFKLSFRYISCINFSTFYLFLSRLYHQKYTWSLWRTKNKLDEGHKDFLRELRIMLSLVCVHWSIRKGCYFAQFSHCITQRRNESSQKQIPPLFRVSGRSRNASISVGGEAMSLERDILRRERWDGWQGLVWCCNQARRSTHSRDSIPITLKYYQSIIQSIDHFLLTISVLRSASYFILPLVNHSAMSSRDLRRTLRPGHTEYSL